MFYQSIAQVYDHIFPQNVMQLTLIDAIVSINENDQILDIGCATGNLTELISRKTKNVIGLDLDEELLTVAKKKFPTLQFEHDNMLNINEKFGPNSFSNIVSFGNTLVHLPNRNDVKTYFENVFECLKTGGHFVTQIIHYDRIINNQVSALSTVDNDHITFTRDYVLHDDYVDFKTKLMIHETNQVIENSIPLLTLTKLELETLLLAVGFEDIKFYGNLKGKKLESMDVPLIFSCKKG